LVESVIPERADMKKRFNEEQIIGFMKQTAPDTPPSVRM
jgi:hypothetical protein